MFADMVVWDDAGRGGEVEEVLSDQEQLRDRIGALDGDTRTLVTVYGGDAHLAVGGDSSAGLVVYATFDNEVFHQLVTGTNGDQEVTVVAGGQPGRYPARSVVPLRDAVTAAGTFAREGRLDERLSWMEQ